MGTDERRVDYPLTQFAIRVEEKDGWIVGEEPRELDEIVATIGQSGFTIKEVREFSSGTAYYRDENGEPAPWDHQGSYAQSKGWAFDEVAEFWRAPEENITQLQDEATRVEDVHVNFLAAHAGWLPIHIEATGQEVVIDFSDYDPPFEKLIDWLEQIVDGIDTRFNADLEGSFAEFFSIRGSAANRIRVAISAYGRKTEEGNRETSIDIDIDRKTFVSSVYLPFREYAMGPFYDPYQWAAVSILEDLREKIPNLPVDQLPHLSATEVNEILLKLYSVNSVSFPDIATDKEKIFTLATWVKDGQKEQPAGMVTTIEPRFEVPEEYEGWDFDRRKSHLDELFNENVTSWSGIDLRKLRSEKLEAFLK